MESPDSPTVPMSEPEKEMRVVEACIEAVASGDKETKIHPDYLDLLGLDLDADGFVIDQETGEYKTPYTYDEDKFSESAEPGGFYFSEVYHAIRYTPGPIPESDHTEKIHISNVYGFLPWDGDVYLIRDNWFDIQKMLGQTGLDIKYKPLLEEGGYPDEPADIVECNVCGSEYNRDQEPPEGASIYWVPACPTCGADVGEPEPTPEDIDRMIQVTGDDYESRMRKRAELAARNLHGR